jgi:transcriptional regulator with XRE-family HTH domain
MATDDQIVRAVGEQLRRARVNRGWSRPEFVKQMPTTMPINTYAGYEQGIRQCSIPRLVEICQVLGVSAPKLLESALRSVEVAEVTCPTCGSAR